MNEIMYMLDFANISEKHITKDGFLKTRANLTRTGIFDYKTSDGKTIKMYRPESEVYSEESLDSIKLAPVVLDHPVGVTPSGMIDSTNAKYLVVGHIGDTLEKNGDYLQAGIIITDAAAIEKIDAGTHEVSCGYCAEVVFDSGEYNGERYDAIQRKIVYNHVAVVERGRAGKEARLILDSDQAVFYAAKNIEEKKMADVILKTVILDGVQYEAESKVIEELNKAQKQVIDLTDSTVPKTELSKVEAERDSLQEKVETLEQNKLDDSAIVEKVTAKIALIDSAKRVLTDAKDLVSKSDVEIMSEALKAKSPNIVLDGKDDVYIMARFDAMIEDLDNAPAQDARVKTHGVSDVVLDSVDDARKKMTSALTSAWKEGK